MYSTIFSIYIKIFEMLFVNDTTKKRTVLL